MSTRFSQWSWVSQCHFAGKGDSRHHSTKKFSKNVIVAGTSYQILEV